MTTAVREYDVVVVGSGSRATIVDAALRRGLKVALAERGPLGGTCLNAGCIPSRLLVFPADGVVEIWEGTKPGIAAQTIPVNVRTTMDGTHRIVGQSRNHRGIGTVTTAHPDLR